MRTFSDQVIEQVAAIRDKAQKSEFVKELRLLLREEDERNQKLHNIPAEEIVGKVISVERHENNGWFIEIEPTVTPGRRNYYHADKTCPIQFIKQLELLAGGAVRVKLWVKCVSRYPDVLPKLDIIPAK